MDDSGLVEPSGKCLLEVYGPRSWLEGSGGGGGGGSGLSKARCRSHQAQLLLIACLAPHRCPSGSGRTFASGPQGSQAEGQRRRRSRRSEAGEAAGPAGGRGISSATRCRQTGHRTHDNVGAHHGVAKWEGWLLRGCDGAYVATSLPALRIDNPRGRPFVRVLSRHSTHGEQEPSAVGGCGKLCSVQRFSGRGKSMNRETGVVNTRNVGRLSRTRLSIRYIDRRYTLSSQLRRSPALASRLSPWSCLPGSERPGQLVPRYRRTDLASSRYV